MDTSTAAVTAVVAECSAGEARVLGSSAHMGAQDHGEQLAVMIDQALSQAALSAPHIDAFVVGVGPGPFTGLRVGIVAARVMGYALDVEVYGICSLDALAATAVVSGSVTSDDDANFAVAADARRREIYWATYAITAEGRAARTDGPYVSKAADLPEVVRLGSAIGRGTEIYVETFGVPRAPFEPSPDGLAHAAAWALEAATTTSPEPMYLRRPDAVAWQ